MSTITFNEAKFGELILYVALRSETDPYFGATKLNKLLFNADFAAYLRLGRPITGADYMKLEKGPAPRLLKPVQNKLESDGSLIVRSVQFYQYGQHKSIALREPHLDLFSAAEIAIVDGVISAAEGLSASEMSAKSHEFIGWKLAGIGESIPYETALLGTGEPVGPEIQKLAGSLDTRARELIGAA
jgi:hypothetical protein